jgi:hypothetical protein
MKSTHVVFTPRRCVGSFAVSLSAKLSDSLQALACGEDCRLQHQADKATFVPRDWF